MITDTASRLRQLLPFSISELCTYVAPKQALYLPPVLFFWADMQFSISFAVRRSGPHLLYRIRFHLAESLLGVLTTGPPKPLRLPSEHWCSRVL